MELAPELINDSFKIDLAKAYSRTQSSDACIKLLDTLVKSNTKNPRVYSLRGTCFLQKQDYPKALADFKTAAKKDPSSKEFQQKIADIQIILQSQKPNIQKEFEQVISEYRERYKRAENALQKRVVREERKKAIKKLHMDRRAKQWVGKVHRISTYDDGSGWLCVELEKDLLLTSISSSFPVGSQTYKTLLSLKEGQKINFSGEFYILGGNSEYSKNYTEYQTMNRPEFFFKFTKITALK